MCVCARGGALRGSICDSWYLLRLSWRARDWRAMLANDARILQNGCRRRRRLYWDSMNMTRDGGGGGGGGALQLPWRDDGQWLVTVCVVDYVQVRLSSCTTRRHWRAWRTSFVALPPPTLARRPRPSDIVRLCSGDFVSGAQSQTNKYTNKYTSRACARSGNQSGAGQ